MPNNNEFYSIKGEEFPRVTNVLDLMGDKKFLIQWAVNTGLDHVRDSLEPLLKQPYQIPHALPDILTTAKKRHIQIRDAAGDRGKEIHKLLERKLKGKKITANYEQDKVITKALTSIDAWIESWGFTPQTYTNDAGITQETVEVRVHSQKYHYAGTADAIGTNSNGELMLIDLKTGKSTHRRMELQCAAYCMAYGEMTGNYPDITMVLHTLPSGTIRAKHVMNREEYEQRFKIFLGALPIYEFFR